MKKSRHVIVLPRMSVKGWSGRPSELDTVGKHPPVPLLEALTRTYRGEACLLQYSAPEPLPRLHRSALAGTHALPGDPPRLEVLLLDVDYPNHQEPHDGWAQTILDRVPPRLSPYTAWYRTPHGLRLILLPHEPVPLPKARGYIARVHAEMRSAGVPVDPATSDWTRLYKAPRALGRDLPSDYSRLRPLPADTFGPLEDMPEDDPSSLAPILCVDAPATLAPPTRSELRPVSDKALREHLYQGSLTAPEGTRHATVLDACITIASDVGGADPRVPYRLVMHSLESLNLGAKRALTPEEVWRMAQWAAAQVQADKIERRERATSSLSRMAARLGVDPQAAQKAVILDTGRQYYVWDEESEDYSRPYINVRQLTAGLTRHAPNISGPWLASEAPDREVLQALSSPVSSVVLDYTIDRAHYARERAELTMPATRPDRQLRPIFDAGVARWLEAFAGTPENHDRLLNWLAAAPDLSVPVCALYIDGPPSVGKGLLARGLARLWDAAAIPCPYAALVGDFAEELLNCPLVVADESIPQDAFKSDEASTFRRLVGNPNRYVNLKGQSPIRLRGYLRTLITANNSDAFPVSEALSPSDLEAVLLRLGYLRLPRPSGAEEVPEPVRVLQALVDEDPEAAHITDITEPWINEGTIANHVLWLNQHREFRRGARFAVEGWTSELTDLLATGHGVAGIVAEVISRAVMAQRSWRSVKWFDGELYVNSGYLAADWTAIFGHEHERPPRSSSIVKALQALQLPDSTQKRLDGSRYWRINPKHVDRFAARRGIAEEGEIMEACAREEPEAPEAPTIKKMSRVP